MPGYAFGSFLLDYEARTLLRDGEPVALTSKAFDTLLLLVQNRGRLVHKDEFFSSVWQSLTVEEANLTQTIFCVRRILGDRPKDHRFIATVPGHGYQFVGEVVEIASANPGLLNKPSQTATESRRFRLAWPWLTGAAVAVSAVLLAVWYYESTRVPSLADQVQLTNDGESKNELVTDGVRVFYASPTQPNLSHWRTYQVSIKGGERESLPIANRDMSPLDISPDRSELLLAPSEVRESDEGWTRPVPIWFQPLGGGSPRTFGLRAHDASWSPDGSEIVYAFEKQIGIAPIDETAGRKLADLPGVASGLRWSPNGATIRFTLHHGVALKDSAIWEIPSTGGKAHPLFPDLKNQQGDGQWTPDGRYYLFSRIDGGVSHIWSLSERKPWLGGSMPGPVPLTTGPIQCFLPTPSPDGKRVLFLGMLERTLLLKYDTRSGRFESFLPGVSGAHLDFSRDAKWLTYSSYPDHALWRAAADGTHRLQISPPSMMAMLPVISPDGTRIAFVGGSPGQPFSIFIAGRDGGALERVISTEPSGLAEPAWSPDGASLILGAFDSKSSLYRFNCASRKLAALPGSEGLWSPRCSPDGRFIAALDSRARITLYDPKSCRRSTLTEMPSFNPAWAHDGQSIYFGSGERNGAWYRVRIRDRRIERVVSLAETGALPAKPSRGVPTWNYWWTGLAPNDSLLAAREAGSIELYSARWIESK